MKRTWKKTLAALMALAMALSLCTIPVAAEEETGTTPDAITTESNEVKSAENETPANPAPVETPTATAVAKIGETPYETLAAAIAAGDNETIVLQSDVTENVVIPGGTTMTLDLNGYKLTNQSDHTILNKGTLTVTGNGTVDNVTHAKAAFFNDTSATAALSGGTYTRSLENGQNTTDSGGNSYYNVLNHGTMTIGSGVTVSQTGAYSSLVENGWQDGSASGAVDTTLTINGGTFSGGLNTLKNDDRGTLIVNNGMFTNVKQAALLNWNIATINDGTFASDNSVILNGYADNSNMNQGKLTIAGGSFTAGSGKAAIAQMGGSTSIGTVSVSGGDFTSDPTAYLAVGYVATLKDGVYTVATAAQIGDTPYATLAAAIAAASGNTVKLMSDLAEDTVIPAGKTMTLDLNGHTLTNASGDTIANRGTLTITDTSAEKTGTVSCPTAGKSALLNDVGGTATLNGGKFDKSRNIDSNDYYVITNHGVLLTINSGVVIESDSTHSSAIENGWYTPSANTGRTSSTMVINGGAVTASGGLYTVKNDDYGVMTINGGTFTNHVASNGCVLNWNELTVTGGTFNAANCSVATMAEHKEGGGAKYDYEKGTTLISGGAFKGALGTNDATPPVLVSISGGTFSADPTSYLASGYSVRQNNGNYEVYRPSSGSSGSSGGGSATTPPKTESKTEGDVTTKTETTTTTNKDGSKTTEVKETVTNTATGEKTETKSTETVAKDGSVTKEEVKTTTAANGAKTEEKTTATVDAKTGTSAATTVTTAADGTTTAAIVVENTKDAKEVTISAESVKSAAKADEATMTVKTAGVEITLDAAAIAAVAEGKGDQVSIAVATVKNEALPDAAKEALKDAVVVDLAISVGGTKVSDFNGGTATVAVNYIKRDGAKVIAVYYVANDGTMKRVPGATYHEKTKSVEFTISHFSHYAVVEETALLFSDVTDADWYYDAVRYVTRAQLFNGTSSATFGPNGAMTREMLATVLYRKAGSPAVGGTLLSEFADHAKISPWATDAMRWAVREGILAGVGEKRLDPQGAVTRQQLAVILYRTAGSPSVGDATLGKFADGASVATWAANGMAWAVQKGVVTGRGNNLLDPTGTANRAEVATMLMRIA